MIRLFFVLPQEEEKELAIRTLREHNWAERMDGAESGEEFTADFIVSLDPEKYLEAMREADVIIARGVTALNIKRLLPDASVTEIPFSSIDIITTIVQSTKDNGNVSVGLVASYNMAYNVIDLAEFLQIDIKKYIFKKNTDEEIAYLVESARQDGCKAIIGGIDVQAYAESIGLPAYSIPIGRGSLRQAISEAKHNALIRSKERAKALLYQTVLNYAHEGVIAVDWNNRVTTVNLAAESILGIYKSACIGKDANEVFCGTKLEPVLNESRELNDHVIQGKDWALNVHKTRMVLSGNFLGYAYTFQSIDTIRKTEVSVRRQIVKHGHTAKYTFAEIIGSSAALNRAIDTAKTYAKVESDILITGKSGTGKELFAQSIHLASRRNKEPFIAVNCAALPKNLIESEMFGYSEGSFTGAIRGGKAGIFESAFGGTVFLDEISELPLEFQGQLLRVFQEREVTRIGSRQVTPIDVRIICATNRSLEDMTREGKFREDLYYRLSVLNLRIPSLKERAEDVIELTKYFLSVFSERFGKPLPGLSSGAVEVLMQQEWRGNVREIRNVCERLTILNNTTILTEAEIIEAFQLQQKGPNANREKEQLMALLKKHKGNKTKAAAELGISRTTLWRKLKLNHLVP